MRSGDESNRRDAAPQPPEQVATPRSRISVDLEPIFQSIARYDHATLENLLNRHAVVLPVPDLVLSVILPLLREVGRRWQAGILRPAQEHLISAIVRHLLGSLLRTQPHRPTAPVIVFATPPGERHELGLLCATLLAARAGHTAVYLGPDLPATDVLDAATTLKASSLVLASTLNVSAAAVREFRRLPRQINLWIGGPGRAQLETLIGDRAVGIESLDAFASQL